MMKSVLKVMDFVRTNKVFDLLRQVFHAENGGFYGGFYGFCAEE